MDTANRVLWTAIGAFLLLLAAAVAAAGLGWLPHLDRDTALLAPALLTRWRHWGRWAWWGVLVAGLVVASLGVALARGQFRRRTGRAIADLTAADLGTTAHHRTGPPASGPPAAVPSAAGTPAGDPGLPGTTRVRSGALVNGLAGDIRRHPRVNRAAVEVTGDATEPRVWARLDVKAGADMPALHRHLAASLARFTATTGLRPTDVEVVVQVRDTNDRVR